jgi:hypothetical protein
VDKNRGVNKEARSVPHVKNPVSYTTGKVQSTIISTGPGLFEKSGYPPPGMLRDRMTPAWTDVSGLRTHDSSSKLRILDETH